MKFSWNWLSDYVDLSGIAPSVVAERFTMTVAELEGVETIGAGLERVLAGRLVAVSQHPDADKLKVFEIDLGGRTARGGRHQGQEILVLDREDHQVLESDLPVRQRDAHLAGVVGGADVARGVEAGLAGQEPERVA